MGTRTALYDVIEDMTEKDAAAKVAHGDEEFDARTLGGKLHKAFMAEIG